jgi:hypothetical protein
VDISEFYEGDERRRQSTEVQFGIDWRDERSIRYELNWVEATGELYLMCEPPPPEWEGPFADVHVRTGSEASVAGMTVEIVGHVEDRAELERILEHWSEAMIAPNSLSWLLGRLRESGISESSSFSSG